MRQQIELPIDCGATADPMEIDYSFIAGGWKAIDIGG